MKKLVFAACALAVSGIFAGLPEKIECEGDYGGHLQGVATDGESIYWSFTVAVVKTDLAGKIIVSRTAPSHQGDLCYKDGKVYVAVNRGRFNTEKKAVSEVTAYDAKTLEPVKTVPLPEMTHGAGGMTWKGDRFYIVGGLPLGHEKNYVYEYTKDLDFVKRHDLDTGFTWMGIQTAAYEDNTFYFGVYGTKGNPAGVIACPDNLFSYSRYICPGSVGIVKLDGAYYLGSTPLDKKTKRHKGMLIRQKTFPDPKKRFEIPRTGKGELRIFFEGRDKTGWKDSGYVFDRDSNKPVFASAKAFVRTSEAAKCKEFPAVSLCGGRKFWTPELVRGVHRATWHDEVFSLVFPGTPESLKNDAGMSAAFESVVREAERLGVKVTGR